MRGGPCIKCFWWGCSDEKGKTRTCINTDSVNMGEYTDAEWSCTKFENKEDLEFDR